MLYPSDEETTGLDLMTTLPPTALILVGDPSDPDRTAKVITMQNLTNQLASLVGGISLFSINQVAHGFAVGDIIRADANQFTKSLAVQTSTTDQSSEAWGIVTAVIDVDNFDARPLDGSRITDVGIVALLAIYVGGNGLFLSDGTPGAFSNLEPSGYQKVSKPIGYVEADAAGNPIALLTTNYRGTYAFYPITGQFTTVGGSATETFTITGAQTSDFPFTQLVNQGTNVVTILTAEVTAPNTLTVVFSANPGNDAVFNYAIHN